MIRIFSLFLLLALTLISCGRKGAPLPPISKKPLDVDNIKLKQQGDYIVVSWHYIPKYDDNRPLKEFSFKIYLNDKEINPKLWHKRSLYWFSYKIPLFRKEYCFNIYVKSKDELSDSSPIECIIPTRNFPATPKITDIELKEDGLLIKWIGEGKNTNIYKSNDEIIPPIPDKKIANRGYYFDKDLQFNKKYCYYLTVENDKEVESNKSNTVCKRFEDIFPPKPPSDFKLLKKGNDYYLIWDNSPSKDVIGYLIYKNGKPLFNIPIKTYFFIDKDYKDGDKYYIVAVDRAGNKSKKVFLKRIIK